MTRNDAAKGIRFDPQRRAASPELRAAVRSLAAFLERREAELGLRQRARKEAARVGFLEAVEAIACNLAGILLSGLDRPLAVPRSSAAMWSGGRYRARVYGQHFLDALNLMAHPSTGLVADVARGFGFATGRAGQLSTIRPTRAFLDHVPRELIGWQAFAREEDPEVLVLRGIKDRRTGRAELIDYRDTAGTRRRRKEVQCINRHLQAAPFWIAAEGGLVGITEEGQPVDPTRRTLRRIFNNGSWYQGGRLFDGFWETMPRDDRFRLIRIGTPAHPEGERIANVDYGQLFPRLAYREIGLTPPEGDLYEIAGEGIRREGWKQLVNALLLSNRPLGNWPEGGVREQFPPGTKFREAVTAVCERHAPIAGLFGSGQGFKFMLLESEMLIAALLRLFAQGVTALPLHDSVLVAASTAGVAEEAMEESFGTYSAGARALLKTTFS